MNREGPSFKTDVYSFGMVVWECLTRKVPWSDVAGVDMLVLAVIRGDRPPVPDDAPADLAALTKACWSQAPAGRPAFKNILCDLKNTGHEEDGGEGGRGVTPLSVDGCRETTRGGSEQDANGVEAGVAAAAVAGVRGGAEKSVSTTRELTSSTASHSTVSLSSYTISSGGSDKFLGDVGRQNGGGYHPTASATAAAATVAAPSNRHRRRGSSLSGSG